jgi:hypothetical protein
VRRPLAADQVGVQDYPEIHLSTVQKKNRANGLKFGAAGPPLLLKKYLLQFASFSHRARNNLSKWESLFVSHGSQLTSQTSEGMTSLNNLLFSFWTIMSSCRLDKRC